LQLPLVQYFQNNIINRCFWESLGQVCGRSGLPLRDIQEDIWYLKDIVKVFFYAVAPLEDFVLVAGDLEALFAFL
jgi:hypothetical protein